MKMQNELQTVKTLIRRLEEQSDLGLHCLSRGICPKTEDNYGKSQVPHPAQSNIATI